MLIKNRYFLSILLLIIFSSPAYSQYNKKLTIQGIRLFPEKEVYSQLQLNRYEKGEIPLSEVITLIEKFYKEKNYTLVKVYKTDIMASGESVLFVDEGRIGKIIVHNLNNYYSLKFKQQVKIPGRIYNTEIIDTNMVNLQSKFPGSEIRVELQKPPDYEGNLIQLDRELRRLKIGEIVDLTFFDRYIPLHDLHFYIENYKGNSFSNGKTVGLGFNIDYKFSSLFIPQLYYYDENIFFSRDYFEGNLSAGIDPGFGGLFSLHPSNTLKFPPSLRFEELTGEYKISPMQNEFIGPLLRVKLYHSDASRNDLGVTKYRFLNSRGTLAPEFTILRYFNIYAGLGLEHIVIYDSSIDYTAEKHINSSDGSRINSFGEARIKIDPIPIRIGNRIDKFIILTYTDYFSGISSNKLEIQGVYDTEFDNLSILSFKTKAVLLYKNPPFYMSESVNNDYFKGFTGKSYYTGRKFSASVEYRFSLYQDFVYAGGFFDWVVFNPEGYTLSGRKQGINFGPTGRVLIYDQFEFTVYFGFDRLFPEDVTGTNMKMKLTKKW